MVDLLRFRAKEKGLELKYEIEPGLTSVVLGDPVRLNQILINLVSNSVKFTYNGDIIVRASRIKENASNVEIAFEVEDSGIGIEKEKLSVIFDSFSQADESITRRFGGTGLGLAIVKQLVEMQDGKISVNSEVNRGTTFRIELPYGLGSDRDLELADPRKVTKQGVTGLESFDNLDVLLVEDNDINQLYASNMLKKWGCVVEIAGNGFLALEMLKKQSFDIILMDIQMPVMDGYDASKAIRLLPSPKGDVPIIALTANAIKGDYEKSLEAGMDDYITKPFIPEDLNQIISRFIKNNPRKSGPSKRRQERFAKTEKAKETNKLVNLDYLRSISGNDKNFISELINSFNKITPEILENMNKGLQDKNWEVVGQAAHKLKPSIALLGIDSLKEKVKTIEISSLQNQNLDAIPLLVEETTEACVQAMDELKLALENDLE